VIVDAHVHVFRPASVVPRVVDELAPAERDAPLEDLLAQMAAAGVDRAVLVPLATEDAYVAQALRAHPGRFAAVAVADAATQGRTEEDPLRALDRRRAGLDFRALRTQWLGDPGRPLAESPMLPVLRRLAQDGLPLWSYVPPEQRPLLAQVPKVVPDLVVVLNHLGFAPHGMRVDDRGRPAFDDPFPDGTVELVERLAAHPRVHLMVSGQYALSREPPPYRDLDGVVRRLAGAFGADRMLWASDLPWTRDDPGLPVLLGVVEATLPELSRDELAAVHGGTACTLFPHLRDQEA
jgi:predicted TIM-barrel fold metal-dependent hydrolase